MREEKNGYQEQVVSFDAGQLLMAAGRAVGSAGSKMALFLRHTPLVLAGAFVGGSIGYGVAPFFQPNVYVASAIFEMMPSPMRLVLEPLTQDNTVVGRAKEKERADDVHEKEDIVETKTSKRANEAQMLDDQKRREDEQKATLLTYKTLIKSPQVRDAVRKKMLRQGIKEVGSFSKVEHVSPTNLVQIEAAHADPYIAYETANAWANTVIEFLTDLNSQQYQQGKSFFWTQYNKSKKETADLEAKIIELKRSYQYELKSTELAAKNELLLGYIKEFETTKASMSAMEATLPAIMDLALREERDEPALRALSDGQERSRIEAKLLKKLERRPEDTVTISKYMADIRNVTGVVNPIYAKLSKQVKDTTISLATEKPRKEMLEQIVDRLSKEVTELQVQVNEFRAKQASLEKDLEIARKQNEMIFGKVSEAELVSAMRFADLRLVSSSSLPESKAPAPTKRFMVFGASWGAFVGFLISYLFLDRIRGPQPAPVLALHPGYRGRAMAEVETEREERASARL
ncbi:MAG: hypothetical protein HY547_06720 [Elusimicrobia bacterium]|nr:hypothetical protein [Elusimicrobiota bacterium]